MQNVFFIIIILLLIFVKQFTAEEFKPRTRATHIKHCEHLLGEAGHHMATSYGVCRNSILNESEFFHVIDGLCPDIMHDVLEGALPYEVKLLLRHSIQQGYFTLPLLNARIKSFKYGPVDSGKYHDNSILNYFNIFVADKPAEISAQTLTSSDNKLKQSGTVYKVINNFMFVIATQMWCLARYLPLLVGDCVPEDDEHWQNFLLLLEIVDCIFSPTCDDNVIAYLRYLLQLHHTEFKRLYPDNSIIPKMHYMLHYPQLMERYVYYYRLIIILTPMLFYID